MIGQPQSPGAVVYRKGPGIDAIDEYSRRLVDALNDADTSGISARYVPDGARAALAGARPAWILLQYNPFAYGRSGFAPGLLRDVRELRLRLRVPFVVMVHEAWVDMTDAKSSVIGLWQRLQLRALLRYVDGIITSTHALAKEIGGGAVHVPVGSNITPIAISHDAARERLALSDRLVVTLFGRGNPSRALDHARAAIRALASAHGPERLVVLNLGADAPTLSVPTGVEVREAGPLADDELSARLRASDLILLPLTDGVSTRRGTLMAALAHGTPVLGLQGHNTDPVLTRASDAIALSRVGDPAAFARLAVEMTRDLPRLKARGEAGRSLYLSHFDWPVIAAKVAEVLEVSRNGRSRRIMFVAHDVGGPGGMERHTEQLIGRLLDAGRPVTVVARTCRVDPRQGLRFKRIRTPSRPFVLAYPAFFAVGSLVAARRRDAVLHCTGAIVCNRVDIATVHYCHQAAKGRIDGLRASRRAPLYLVNSWLGGFMSRAAERWCYRPERTRVLCAVSDGVAAELREAFPSKAHDVHTIANGVDSHIFRPDASVRRSRRAGLGLHEDQMLALFVGGDWDRKGLAHAVDAVALAPGWQLAVAGPGDPAPLVARARSVGTASRVRFLGRVEDMAGLYAASDAFVLPTTYEAFPLVSLEAAASGLPMLVTRVNGVEDFLLDGVTGWFVERDSADIAGRLNELRTDPARAIQMAVRAREAAGRYSWEAMAHRYLSLYDQVADGA
jgi:glycosyltransferase involved in cell wall biosynthesis